MIKPVIEEAINSQINKELYSAYLYLSMSAYFHGRNLEGFANWMEVQTQEEMMHAKKFYDYLISRGGKVKLMPIDGPKTTWDSPDQIFDETYKHEQLVTESIDKLMDLAVKEGDHATQAILQWYVTEQVEEEANASGILEKLRLTGKDGSAIFLIDRELALRTFNMAAYQQQAAQ
ncbi:MAG: ferritin [Spirochaetes bacterium]|jgi:ferritin|nr:ferritin [Spirochaetota bacterium]